MARCASSLLTKLTKASPRLSPVSRLNAPRCASPAQRAEQLLQVLLARVLGQVGDARTLFSSRRRFMERPWTPPAPAPRGVEGGTWPPFPGALASSSPSAFSDPRPSTFIAARSLSGFVVQWSAVTRRRCGTRAACSPSWPSPRPATSAPRTRSSASRARDHGVEDDEFRLDSSPGLYRCASPNLAHFLRAASPSHLLRRRVHERVLLRGLDLLESSDIRSAAPPRERVFGRRKNPHRRCPSGR